MWLVLEHLMYSGSGSCTNVAVDKKKHVTEMFKRSEEKSKQVRWCENVFMAAKSGNVEWWE